MQSLVRNKHISIMFADMIFRAGVELQNFVCTERILIDADDGVVGANAETPAANMPTDRKMLGSGTSKAVVSGIETSSEGSRIDGV